MRQSRAAQGILLGALTLALAIAGCGGGGDETSDSTQSTIAQGRSAASAHSETQGSKSGPRSKDDDKGKAGGKGSKEAQGSKANAAPLEVSGGGSSQFEVKGGDNSVQRYGFEAQEAELREAAEAVHSFYVARIAEEWARACTHLSKATVEGFQQLAARAPQLKGKGCAQILDALTEPLSSSLQRDATTVDAAALRHEGEQGFLIYTGPPHETVYSMPLSLEGGAWKLGAISASVLPGT